MGYGDRQIRDLEATINGCPCDLVLSATPIDLTAVVTANKPVVRVRYTYQDNSSPTLEAVIRERLSDRL
jgi:predicted GTPase